jgi:hypothetical protein
MAPSLAGRLAQHVRNDLRDAGALENGQPCSRLDALLPLALS